MTKVTEAAEVVTVPELSTRQQLHLAAARGRTVLDRLHFGGLIAADLDSLPDPDSISMLNQLIAALCLPYELDHDDELTKKSEGQLSGSRLIPSEHLAIIRNALGLETDEGTKLRANAAARTVADIAIHGIDSVDPPLLYEVQDVVMQVWQETLPEAFCD